MNILLVENNEVYIKAIKLLFAENEYQITDSRSIKEAREQLESFKVQIILLDINLSDGNGLELVRLLREEKKDFSTYIILITSESQEDVVTNLYDLGIDYYIKKPFSPFHLKSIVNRIIKRIDSN